MEQKWNVVLKDGKPVRAGYCGFDLAAGETMVAHPDIVGSVVSAIVSARPKEKSAADLVAELEAKLKAKGVL